MLQLSFKVDEESASVIDEYAESHHDGVRADALRELVQRGLETEDLERQVERLEREKEQIISARQEHQELVEYVENEMSLQQRQEERRGAPAWRRFRWWLLGNPET